MTTQEAINDAMQPLGGITSPDHDDGWEWAIVEIMGHRKHYGRTREVERFGAKMLRVDIPKEGDPEKHGWETVFYSGTAIFSYSLSDEASVRQANKPYELPSLLVEVEPGLYRRAKGFDENSMEYIVADFEPPIGRSEREPTAAPADAAGEPEAGKAGRKIKPRPDRRIAASGARATAVARTAGG